MTRLTRSIAFLIVLYVGTLLQTVKAQSVLDPSDPVITYDSTRPPTQPVNGQIGKWVRTVRMSWNTDMYKAYIYKGLAFRLHFPKTYNPTAVDGKKYPLLLFFHGHGEYGPIYDNEFHLLHGHQGFDQAINNGTFDGYVLSAQSTNFFNITDYDRIIEIVNYMIANNKVDPFQISVNGLSQGGQACWEMQYNFPTYISASLPMSWTQTSYTDPGFVNKVKYTPTWVFQGSTDVNPPPSTTYQVRDAMVAAGANFTLTEYQGVGHGTWWLAWGEPDFWPFIKRAYSSNPWQIGGKVAYWPGAPINATLGLPAGFSAYEWRKDGVLISGATSNTLTVTAGGVYSARVQRNGLWSDWSRLPVSILPGRFEAEDYTAMSGVQTEYTQDAGGGKDVGWIEQGDWMDYSINPNAAGTYTLNLRIATPGSGAQIKVKNSAGQVLATVNVPNTGGWQTWQTVSTTLNLATGPQTLRLESSATVGWNINWLEFSTGGAPPANQPPTANAGVDKTITLPTNSVTLNGSGSDPDGSIASYSWSKVSGPSGGTISSPSSASTTVTGLVQGSYTFRLTVSDNKGATAFDEVSITVNAAPGSTTRIEAENWTAMSGVVRETTTDVGGGQSVGYIDPGDWMEYSYTAPSTGTYTVSLRLATPADGSQLQIRTSSGTVLATVNIPNTGGWQSWQTVSVTLSLPQGPQTLRIVSTSPQYKGWNINWWELAAGGSNVVNQPPTVNAGADQTITLPANSVQLTGTAADADGSVASYAWSKVSGPAATIASPSSASTTVTGLVQGVYTFRLTVSDDKGATASDDVVVTVNAAANQPPTANAGIDKSIMLPTNSVTLTGTASDPDGSIVSYSWTKVSGGTATITSPSSASTTVAGLVQGSYVFRLTVVDNQGASATDEMTVVVNAAANQLPSANAGVDQTITLPTNSVTLSGTASDPDGSIASYSWSKVSGGAATISSPSSAATTVTGLTQGSYTFRLTVKDNAGATASDDVVVTVNPALPATSLRIEAEAFTMASSVTKQACQDLGGGQQVSALDNGDWMQYWVEVPYTGTYTVNFRVATTKGGSKFQLLNVAGLVLGTVNLPNTGSLQAWQTVSIQATLTAGGQALKIFVNKASGNLIFNWWELTWMSANSGTQTFTNRGTLIDLQDPSATTSASSFLAYPNPFQDHFTMQVQNSYIGPVKVQLFNLSGVLQKQFAFDKTKASVQLTLSLSDLPRGEYLLMVLTNKWEQKGKVIKL